MSSVGEGSVKTEWIGCVRRQGGRNSTGCFHRIDTPDGAVAAKVRKKGKGAGPIVADLPALANRLRQLPGERLPGS
jgi:hypothetical protein